MLSSKVTAELDFFRDLDPDKEACLKQAADRSCPGDNLPESEPVNRYRRD